jgi:ribosomal protein S1
VLDVDVEKERISLGMKQLERALRPLAWLPRART